MYGSTEHRSPGFTFVAALTLGSNDGLASFYWGGWRLDLSLNLFVIGVVGVLTRRNAIIIFMCVELMLNAVNLTFVALAQQLGPQGQVIVFFVMAVAAAMSSRLWRPAAIAFKMASKLAVSRCVRSLINTNGSVRNQPVRCKKRRSILACNDSPVRHRSR